MADTQHQPTLLPVGRPLSLIPVGLKEAALDSPSFRATAVHFFDQVELIDKWLDGFVKASGKLLSEVSPLENHVNNFLSHCVPPAHVSEALLDHDYTLLAMKTYGEGSRDFWSFAINGMKKMEGMVIDPIKGFLQGDLKNFKDARRTMEHAQKYYDNLLSRYSAQTKTKEPSSLREDAFQLHEARKSYLKASLDLCVLAPQMRNTLDKLLVRLFSDHWREMKSSRSSMTASTGKMSQEIDRVRGWCSELENGEKAFIRELLVARKQIEENAEYAARPSRELDDYSTSTVPYLGSKGPSGGNRQLSGSTERAEKQGWLYIRTMTGKPTRTLWVRRWFFVKNGIFGWLVQGSRSGGVEESERVGVLLCSVRPAPQDERRFCFEVITKASAILLQAETQQGLVEWIDSFEVAKRKALEDPASTDSPLASGPRAQEAAFAINPPSAPEFAAKPLDSHTNHGSDEASNLRLDQAAALTLPDRDAALASRSSFDVGSSRRSTPGDRDPEGTRDHAARIIQKLDLHRKSNASQLASNASSGPSPIAPSASGGIASLISASHNILPVYSTPAITQVGPGAQQSPGAEIMTAKDIPSSTLAPSTLVNPPAPTNLSKAAVVVSGERGIGVGRSDKTGGMPSGIMANIWGSTNWGYINRLERGEVKPTREVRALSIPPSPLVKPTDGTRHASAASSRAVSPSNPHRRTFSSDADLTHLQQANSTEEEYPSYYPLPLKAQDYQFRMLFPNVPRDEKVVLVFRATWNPNDQQEFPGRVYVTPKEIYFYSHHLGLILISGINLDSISEVTAAPGRDCDYLYLQLKEKSRQEAFTRVTIKTFLEPMKLLQKRLNYLVRNSNSDEPQGLESIIKELINLEKPNLGKSPSMESWEDVSLHTPFEDNSGLSRSISRRRDLDLRADVRVDRGLYSDANSYVEGREPLKFKLPAQPVIYLPQDMQRLAVEKIFEISPKALFHVMFGDKSAVFQTQYHERRAQRIKQGPWLTIDHGHMRRDLDYDIDFTGLLGKSQTISIVDYQFIDVMNDHLCYVVTDRKTPWHLPKQRDFMLATKIVITHVAKSRCKLAIYTKVDWNHPPTFFKGLVESQALGDLHQDALDLADTVTDQVRLLGPNSRTKKAIRIFGHVGQQTQGSQLPSVDLPPLPDTTRPIIRQRSLLNLLLEASLSLAETTASSFMMTIFAILKAIWKISSAHAIILSLLIMSIFSNSLLASKDTLEWWNERKASNFMSRVGVGPNIMMSKAVYLRDLDEAFSNRTEIVDDPGNRCLSTFQTVASLHDIDAPHQSAGGSFSEPSTKSVARRLRRSRQHLGSYRHDLLVAMRVVNSIEREMMKAEWENWLVDEVSRCRQVQAMLEEKNRTAATARRSAGEKKQQVLAGDEHERLEEVRSCANSRLKLGSYPMGSSSSPLLDLAAEVSTAAKTISEYLTSQNLPQPSFDADGPATFPVPPSNTEIQRARLALIEASHALHDLAVGPTDSIKRLPLIEKHNLAALQVINRFQIAKYVPLTGDISFEELASKVGLDIDRVQRVVRQAMTCRIFTEPRDEYVAHTATSKLLRDPGVSAWVGHNLEEHFPASAKLSDTFEKYEHSKEPDQSALTVAFDYSGSYWDLITEHPDRAQRFSDAMGWATDGGAYSTEHLANGFDWAKLGKATVVDVGGSAGYVGIALAQRFPDLSFIVQDLPVVRERADSVIPANLKHRVSFVAHDFFQTQPCSDAHVYILRQILHDWSDLHSIKIIRSLIPALNEGDHVLVVDSTLSHPNTVPLYFEKVMRSLDMQMMSSLNACERTLPMWEELFQQADKRFKLANVVTPPGSAVSILDFVF
ncbi:MAG: hypothetical protein M1819_006162 [Sarea resinae]|nr:MAG: hypothetical protein M1819_006162 [Sarea resinae]